MIMNRMSSMTSVLILGAVGVCMLATTALVAFPGNPAVWSIAAWTLTFGLLGLLVFVTLSAYLLATRRVARTRRQIASLAVGAACLAIVAIGSL